MQDLTRFKLSRLTWAALITALFAYIGLTLARGVQLAAHSVRDIRESREDLPEVSPAKVDPRSVRTGAFQ